MNTKKILSATIASALIASSAALPVFAVEQEDVQFLAIIDTNEEIVDVTLDGKKMEFDVPAQIINDRTMVPMRAIFEALGATVQWEEESQTIVSIKGDKTIIMQIDNDTMFVNNDTVTLDVPAMLVNDRTLVPVRAVSEGMGAKVDWDEAAQNVIITTADPAKDAAEDKTNDKADDKTDSKSGNKGTSSTGTSSTGTTGKTDENIKTDDKTNEAKPGFDAETGITTIIVNDDGTLTIE